MEWQKMYHCIVDPGGIPEAEIDDIRVFGLVFWNKAPQWCRDTGLLKMLVFGFHRRDGSFCINYKINLGLIRCPPEIQFRRLVFEFFFEEQKNEILKNKAAITWALDLSKKPKGMVSEEKKMFFGKNLVKLSRNIFTKVWIAWSTEFERVKRK